MKCLNKFHAHATFFFEGCTLQLSTCSCLFSDTGQKAQLEK